MKEQKMSIKSLNFWFYLFAIMTVILVAFFKGITIASAHTFGAMLFMKQVESVSQMRELESKQKALSLRMDLIDPYKEKD